MYERAAGVKGIFPVVVAEGCNNFPSARTTGVCGRAMRLAPAIFFVLWLRFWCCFCLWQSPHCARMKKLRSIGSTFGFVVSHVFAVGAA
jgi:hypothetical protein